MELYVVLLSASFLRGSLLVQKFSRKPLPVQKRHNSFNLFGSLDSRCMLDIALQHLQDSAK